MDVLIVDNHPLFVDALANVLRQLADDVDVTEATSSEDARLKAERYSGFHLIVVDLDMLGSGGVGLVESLRGSCPSTPVVALARENDVNLAMAVIRCGAAGFIPKSSRREIMINALSLVLSGGIYFPPEVVGLAPHIAPITVPKRCEFSLTVRQRQKMEDLGVSEREIEVLELLVAGHPNKVIGQELQIAECTVKAHVTSIFRAVQVASRAQLIYHVTRGQLA